LESSNLLTSLDLASIHRSKVSRNPVSLPTYDAKSDDQCSKLSEFPYSTVVGPSRSNDVESETQTFVESNKLDQCFTSGRVTVRNNISSFDETVHSYPSRFVPASETRPPFQHYDDPRLRTQAPSAPFTTSSAPYPCRERMCDAEVRHIDARQPPSFTARERVSDAEVWNSSSYSAAQPRELSSTSAYYGGAPTMAASDRRALAQAMANGYYATRVADRRVSAAPAPAPRTCVLPLTVTALASPRPMPARCYTYQPSPRGVRKEHQYC